MRWFTPELSTADEARQIQKMGQDNEITEVVDNYELETYIERGIEAISDGERISVNGYPAQKIAQVPSGYEVIDVFLAADNQIWLATDETRGIGAATSDGLLYKTPDHLRLLADIIELAKYRQSK